LRRTADLDEYRGTEKKHNWLPSTMHAGATLYCLCPLSTRLAPQTDTPAVPPLCANNAAGQHRRLAHHLKDSVCIDNSLASALYGFRPIAGQQPRQELELSDSPLVFRLKAARLSGTELLTRHANKS
jgi:hypothetical protein